MKKQQVRLVKNHPAYDRGANRWVKVLSYVRPGVLLVQDLLDSSRPPREVGRRRLYIWHPDYKLSEAPLTALMEIPNGSKVKVGTLTYQRVPAGWLAKNYDDLLEFEFSWYLPDQEGTAKYPDRWQVDCGSPTGELNYLETPSSSGKSQP